MAIAVRGTPTTSSNSAGSAVSTSIPSGIQTGDILIWSISATTATITATPSGWLLWQSGTTVACNLLVVYRIVDGTEGSTASATLGAAARHSATMVAYSGVDTTTPQDITVPAVAKGTTTIAFDAITPATNGAWVLAHLGFNVASGVTNTTVSTNNLDAIDAQISSNAASATNNVGASGHFAWTSGAFTPNMSSSNSVVRNLRLSSALRPASATTHSGIASFSAETSLTATASNLIPTHSGVAAFSSETTFSAAGTRTASATASFSSESNLTVTIAEPTITNYLLRNTFENGTNNVALTDALTADGGDKFRVVDGGGIVTYDTSKSVTGSRSMRVNSTGTTAYVEWKEEGLGKAPWSTSYVRFYLYMTANPTSTRRIFLCNDVSSATAAAININTSGKVVVSSNLGIDITTTNSISLNQWVRIELKIVHSETAGSAEVRLYNNATSSTATETGTSVDTDYAANGDEFRFGSTGAVTQELWMDEIALSPDNWIGHTEAAGIVLDRWQGAITPTTASVNFRTLSVSSARLGYTTNSDLSTGLTFTSSVTPNAGGYSRFDLTGLTANTTYYFFLEDSSGQRHQGVVDRGSFKTFPTAGSEASFTIHFGACLDNVNSTTVLYNSRERATQPLLWLMTGDLQYQDIGVNDQTVARAAHRYATSKMMIKQLLRDIPMDYIPDDHDYGGNNADENTVSLPAIQSVYREAVPHYTLPVADSLEHAFSIGRVRFIVLDTRAHRTDEIAVDNSSKTVLGATQKAWLKSQLLNATEEVKVVVSGMVWNATAADNEDHWGEYTTERTELLDYITTNNIDNIYFISGDMHGLAADDGTNAPGGWPAVQAGPLENTGSVKGGGTWSQGQYPTTLLTNTYENFGILSFTDASSTITIDFTGYDHVASTNRMTMSTVFSVGATTHSGIASFSAETSLTAAGTTKKLASASFSSETSLTAAGVTKKLASASFSSETSLTAAGVTKKLASASFSSETSLTALGSRTAQGITAFSVQTSLTAVGVRTTLGSVSYSGESNFNLSAAGRVIKLGVASFSSETSLTAAGVTKKLAAASFSVETSLTAAGTTKKVASASFSSETSLTALGSRTAQGIASFSSETSLTATSSRVTQGIAAFSVESSLTAIGSRTAKGIASFSSETSLTASGSRTAKGIATLSAESSLTALGIRTTLGSVSYSGESNFNLSAAGRVIKLGIASFSSESSLTAAGTTKKVASASFSSETSLTALGSRTAQGIAAFSAQSSLTATGSRTAQAIASFSAQSSLAATGVRTTLGSVSYSGESNFSLLAAGTVTKLGVASFSSETSLTAVGVTKKGASASFSSESSLTASGSRAAQGIATFSSESSLSASGSRIAQGITAFSVQSSLTATGSRTAQGIAVFSADGHLSAEAGGNVLGTAVFSAQSSLTASGIRTTLGSVSYSGESNFSLVAAGTVTKLAVASFSSETSMTASGTLKKQGIVSFSADGSLVASAIVTKYASASFSAQTNLTASGLRITQGDVDFSGESNFSLIAAGTVTKFGILSLSAESSLTAVADSGGQGTASFSSESSLTVSGSVTSQGMANLSSESSLSASGTIKKQGSTTLSSESSLSASASRTTYGAVAFSSEASLNAAGLIKTQGAVSYSGESNFSLTAAGTVKKLGSASFAADGSLVATSTLRKQGAVSFSTDGSMVVTSTLRKQGTVSLSGESSLVSTATVIDASIGYFGIPIG